MSYMSYIGLEGVSLQRFIDYVSQEYGHFTYAVIAERYRKIQPLISRAGGLPYWDFSQEYPRDKQGNPLCFLCQINLAELAAVPLTSSPS